MAKLDASKPRHLSLEPHRGTALNLKNIDGYFISAPFLKKMLASHAKITVPLLARLR